MNLNGVCDFLIFLFINEHLEFEINNQGLCSTTLKLQEWEKWRERKNMTRGRYDNLLHFLKYKWNEIYFDPTPTLMLTDKKQRVLSLIIQYIFCNFKAITTLWNINQILTRLRALFFIKASDGQNITWQKESGNIFVQRGLTYKTLNVFGKHSFTVPETFYFLIFALAHC